MSLKSTVVGSLKAPKPSSSRRIGLTRERLVEELGEQGLDPLVGDALRPQELAEQLLWAAPVVVAPDRLAGRWSGHVDAHVDDPRPEQPADVVGQPGLALAADDDPQPRVVGDVERGELVERAPHGAQATARRQPGGPDVGGDAGCCGDRR